MCTLKFYLYCKENKKGPNFGPGGRGQTTEVSGCAPCGLCSGCRCPRTCPTQTQSLTLPPLPTQMKDSVFLPHSLASGSVSIKALELNASYSHLVMDVSSFLARTRSAQDGGVLGWHDRHSVSWSGCGAAMRWDTIPKTSSPTPWHGAEAACLSWMSVLSDSRLVSYPASASYTR